MYLRILAVVAIFNIELARVLALPLGALSLAGFAICALQYRLGRPAPDSPKPAAMQLAASGNPLELGAAAVFAGLFVAVSVVSAVAKSQFGISGIYGLAAIVGVTDIDPFVLNLAQGRLVRRRQGNRRQRGRAGFACRRGRRDCDRDGDVAAVARTISE